MVWSVIKDCFHMKLPNISSESDGKDCEKISYFLFHFPLSSHKSFPLSLSLSLSLSPYLSLFLLPFSHRVEHDSCSPSITFSWVTVSMATSQKETAAISVFKKAKGRQILKNSAKEHFFNYRHLYVQVIIKTKINTEIQNNFELRQ